MSQRFKILMIATAAATALIPASASAGAAKGNLVAAAMQSQDHQTLVAAVKAAGLVDTLAGRGPFTVFAPTDAAFAKLPAGTVDTLLKPANRDQLRSVLTYHVVPGKVSSAQLVEAIRKGRRAGDAENRSGRHPDGQPGRRFGRNHRRRRRIGEGDQGRPRPVERRHSRNGRGIPPHVTASRRPLARQISAAGAPHQIQEFIMPVINKITLLLLIVGGLNWGLVGLFDFDLVAALFGEMSLLSRIVYTLVGAAALAQLIPLFVGQEESRRSAVRS